VNRKSPRARQRFLAGSSAGDIFGDIADGATAISVSAVDGAAVWPGTAGFRGFVRVANDPARALRLDYRVATTAASCIAASQAFILPADPC
jgi:hypothetical protein